MGGTLSHSPKRTALNTMNIGADAQPVIADGEPFDEFPRRADPKPFRLIPVLLAGSS